MQDRLKNLGGLDADTIRRMVAAALDGLAEELRNWEEQGSRAEVGVSLFKRLSEFSTLLDDYRVAAMLPSVEPRLRASNPVTPREIMRVAEGLLQAGRPDLPQQGATRTATPEVPLSGTSTEHFAWNAALGQAIHPVGKVRVSGPVTARLKGRLGLIPAEWTAVIRKAKTVVEQLPSPDHPGHVTGLILGRIQAGKTNAMIATSALAVDNGFRLIVVLTSDNTWLYDQTLRRFKQNLPGITCAGMTEWEDKQHQISANLQTGGVVLVSTKNRLRLEGLIRLVNEIGVGLTPTLVFDDEADQASLDRNAYRQAADPTTTNGLITALRRRFDTLGFIQVTATPQAILLLDKGHPYRPEFITVLEPGSDYVGGDTYFGPGSPYLIPVPIDEITVLKKAEGSERLPPGLRCALLTFFTAATAKLMPDGQGAYSCLIHISLSRQVHARVGSIVQSTISEMSRILRGSGTREEANALIAELRKAYDELLGTAGQLPEFDLILHLMGELFPSADIQILNSTTETKQPRYDSPFNIIIGGTKLGRGVTIQGLLVTYYGRDSVRPQMDTVQQHARMYGYRKFDLPVSRIFLPDELASRFRDITVSENELREWLSLLPRATFDPLLIGKGMLPTRKEVLNPNTVGCYVPGRAYTPGPSPFVGFKDVQLTEHLDRILGIPARGRPSLSAETVDYVLAILSYIQTPPGGTGRWEDRRIRAALRVLGGLYSNTAYVAVFAGRDLRPNEKPNVADSDDLNLVPRDFPALLMFRQNGRVSRGWAGVPFWIPVVRFPEGRYPVSFNFS